MGLNTLPTRSIGTIVTDWWNAFKTALCVDHVPRNAAGVPTLEAGSLGTEDYPWLNVRAKNFYVDGELLDPAALQGDPHRILSGKATANGYPDFLEPAGSGNGLSVTLEAADTDLVAKVDANDLVVTSDLQWSALTAAPSSQNTCTVNEATFSTQPEMQVLGEHGEGYITITSIGTGITALNGTIAAFKKGSEIFLAKVDTSNSRLYPLFRGWCGTTAETLPNGATITLLKVSTLLIKSDETRVATTYYPESVDTAPAAATAGKVYFEKSTGRIGYDTGTTIDYDYIVAGYAVCDTADCKWVQHADFALAWSDHFNVNIEWVSTTAYRIKAGSSVSVAGRLVKFFRDYDITQSANMDSGVSIADTKAFYLYVSSGGIVYISDVHPRKRSDTTLGLYHPTKYYRCLAVVPTSASNAWEAGPYPLEGTNRITVDTPSFSANKTAYLPFPAMFRGKTILFRAGAGTNAALFTISPLSSGANVFCGPTSMMTEGDFIEIAARDRAATNFVNQCYWFGVNAAVSYFQTTKWDNFYASDPNVTIGLSRRFAGGAYDIVTAHLSTLSTTAKSGTTDPTTIAAIPSLFRPSATQVMAAVVVNGGDPESGYVAIDTSGIFTLGCLAGWTAAGNAGMTGFVMIWMKN